MESIDKFIEASKKLTLLAEEYKQAKIYEKCAFVIAENPTIRSNFFLIDKSTNQIIKDGNAAKIKKWLELRKIPSDKVYNFSLLK